GFGLNKII
ncbi:hypothetical protein D046_1759B, partial [Vibrio parahaemolyticus V-223/04]